MVLLGLIIGASLFVSIISFIGGLFLFFRQFAVEKISRHLVSFAAGTMLAVSFLDLLPEALKEGGGELNIFLPAFLGIVIFFFLERFVLWFHHHDSLHDTQPTAVLVLLGDGIHNFIDGAAIAATFLASLELGIATTLAIIAHEIPQEIADFSVLIHVGMKKTQALFFNFLSALAALLGAVGGFYFLESLENMLPLLLSFTGGMFVYIACADLIPEMHRDFRRQRSWVQTLPFVMGIVILWILIKLLGD